jgi:hypothetical protein
MRVGTIIAVVATILLATAASPASAVRLSAAASHSHDRRRTTRQTTRTPGVFKPAIVLPHNFDCECEAHPSPPCCSSHQRSYHSHMSTAVNRGFDDDDDDGRRLRLSTDEDFEEDDNEDDASPLLQHEHADSASMPLHQRADGGSIARLKRMISAAKRVKDQLPEKEARLAALQKKRVAQEKDRARAVTERVLKKHRALVVALNAKIGALKAKTEDLERTKVLVEKEITHLTDEADDGGDDSGGGDDSPQSSASAAY